MTALAHHFGAPLALLLAAAVPAGLSAQDLAFDPRPTADCVAVGQATSCAGRAANACQDQPGGYTTYGMIFCLSEEAGWWDARLNEVYTNLRTRDAVLDREAAEWEPDAPSRAEALRDMQRAWIDFRDAACAYEASQWGSGTGRGPAANACMLQLTAAQVATLQTYLEGAP
jgi:uncharacterized protein YecT (DUF1311 family)